MINSKTTVTMPLKPLQQIISGIGWLAIGKIRKNVLIYTTGHDDLPGVCISHELTCEF